MRQSQALLDAYARDGWGGGAKDKVKPTAELGRARERIFNCKLKIRELFKGIELDPNEREITTVEDEFGEVDVEVSREGDWKSVSRSVVVIYF